MEIVLVLLMSLTATGVTLWSMSSRDKKGLRVFRFTTFEDEDHVQHVFLVYSTSFELAQKDAMKMVILNDTEIQKVEELDSTTWDVIATPYKKVQKSFVKTKKIT